MKKLILLSGLSALLCVSSAYAQTPPAAPAQGASAPLTAEQQKGQQMNILAAKVAQCTITKRPPIGWKGFNVSLDREGAQLLVRGYVITNSNAPQKVELCDRQQVAQHLVDMLNLTTNNKPGQWQSLLLRMQPNNEFEFAALTASDVEKLLNGNPTPSKP
jgi:hypothetical protein